MQVYILNPSYERVAMIDNAESVLWNKKFNDVGQSEIYNSCDAEHLDVLQIGNYIFRYDDDMFCKIVSVGIETSVEQGDYIIATAQDVSILFAGRIVRYGFAFTGTVAEYIYRLIDENVINADGARKINNFVFDTSNFAELTETIETSATPESDLLQLIITTCKASNYGFRLSYDIMERKLVFRLYKGKNKAINDGNEYVEFSPTFSNILSSSYKEDESNYKNVAYVGYENEKGKHAFLSAYIGEKEPQGEARQELYIGETSVSREVTYEELKALYPQVTPNLATKKYYENDLLGSNAVATFELADTPNEDGTIDETIYLTDYAYIPLLRQDAINALAERTKTQEFGGNVDTIDTYEYKVDYNLGDIVKVINDYGIEAEAQITEIMESEDNDNGYQCEPKFEYIS